MSMSKRLLGCFSFATAVALAGCGGSGSDTNETADAAAESGDSLNSSLSVSGVASKGVLKNALITAYELDDQGRRAHAIGTAETNEEGAYDIQVGGNYSGGLIELEASAQQDKTLMTCDAEYCGSIRRFDDVPVPADFSLLALTETTDGGQVSVSVSAWSTMVAKRAKALAADDPNLSLQQALERANSEVSQLVGFDVANTAAVGLAQLEDADAGQAQYAVMNAAAAEILFRADGSGNMVAELERFTEALADDGVIGRGNENFSLADLADAIDKITSHSPHLDESAGEALSNQVAQFELAGSAGFVPGYDHDFSLGKHADHDQKIEAFQGFVAQVRTWASSVEELSEVDLTSSIAVDSDTVETLVDGRTQSQLRLLGEVVDQVVAHIAGNPADVLKQLRENSQAYLPVEDEHGRQLGSAALTFDDREGLQVALTGNVLAAGGQSLPFDLELQTGLNLEALGRASHGEWDERHQLVNLLASAEASITGSIKGYQDIPTLELAQVALVLEVNPTISENSSGREHKLDLFGAATLAGNITISKQGARFSGNVKFGLARLGRGLGGEAGPMSLAQFRLAGDFTSADGLHQFSASASVNVRSATAFDSLDWVEGMNTKRLITGCFCGADELFSLASSGLDDAVLPGYALRANLNEEPRNGTIHFAGYTERDPADYDTYRSCVAGIQELRRDADASVPDKVAILRDTNISAIKDAEKWCANSFLVPVYEQQQLTDRYLERFQRHVDKRLKRKYGAEIAAETTVEDFYGYAEQGEYNGFFAALVDLPDVAGKDAQDLSFTVATRVELPELRAANVSATFNHTSYRGSSLRTNVKWNGGSYTALVSVDDTDKPSELSARLYNAQGYELTLNLEFTEQSRLKDLTGSALIDGEPVGHVELRDDIPVILYPKANGDVVIESLY